MAAIGVGSIVLPIASVIELVAIVAVAPKLGIVESAVAGPPPTSVVVDWGDGTRTTYAVTGAGSTSQIAQFLTPTSPLLLGTILQPIAGLPDPGGRVQGPCVLHCNLADPSGTALGEFVVVQTPEGFWTSQIAGVQVVPNA